MIMNTDKDTVIATHVSIAKRSFSRMMGLMGKKRLLQNHALLIHPCQQVHTFFMRFTLDCLFIDDDWRVAGIYQNVKPWRISPHFSDATAVIELPGGTIEQTDTEVDDLLKFERDEAIHK